MSAVFVQVLFGLSRRRPGPDDAMPAIRAGRWVVAPSGGPGPLASGSLGAAPAGAAPREARPRRCHWQWRACSGVLHASGRRAQHAPGVAQAAGDLTWAGADPSPHPPRARGPPADRRRQQLLLATRLKETSERLSWHPTQRQLLFRVAKESLLRSLQQASGCTFRVPTDVRSYRDALTAHRHVRRYYGARTRRALVAGCPVNGEETIEAAMGNGASMSRVLVGRT
jgi:hypothetical protein